MYPHVQWPLLSAHQMEDEKWHDKSHFLGQFKSQPMLSRHACHRSTLFGGLALAVAAAFISWVQNMRRRLG